MQENPNFVIFCGDFCLDVGCKVNAVCAPKMDAILSLDNWCTPFL